MKLAILECDDLMPEIKQVKERYGVIFEKLLKDAGFKGECTYFDVVSMEYPENVNHFDGYLLTGSKHNCYDNDEWILKLVQFTKSAYDAQIPLVGICFGHQIIARSLGSRTGKNSLGWEISAVTIDLNDYGKKILPGFGDTIGVMQMHQDVVFDVPPNTELFASTQICKVHGFHQPGRVWAVQGHPEYDSWIVTQMVNNRNKSGRFSDEFSKEALSRVNDKNDGTKIAKFIVSFLENKD